MCAQPIAEEAVVISVCGPQGHLASATLARAFGLDPKAAEQVIARGQAILPGGQANAGQRAVLRLLGVETLALGDGLGARFDLGAWPRDPKDGALRQWLARAMPGGPVLEGLTRPMAEDWALRLRAQSARIGRGLEVAVLPHAGALHDLFAPACAVLPPELGAYLSHLGLGRAPAFSDAVAMGLTRAMLRLVLRRFAGLGLWGVHQSFARYDLQLTGPGELSPRELADFLIARGCGLPQAGPVVLERDLSRASARAFALDYGLIGLPVRAVLRPSHGENR